MNEGHTEAEPTGPDSSLNVSERQGPWDHQRWCGPFQAVMNSSSNDRNGEGMENSGETVSQGLDMMVL